MRITVRVKPNAKAEKLEKTGECEYKVSVKAPAKEGRANKAVIAALSEYFDHPKSRFSIVRGDTGKIKLIDIS